MPALHESTASAAQCATEVLRGEGAALSGDAAARLHADRGCSSEDGPSLEMLCESGAGKSQVLCGTFVGQ